ncbi:uncharacterized protein LOC143277661 isoform X2 [Babylonia areolata]|uniref:uncharacterized protein LOC143277661 isoform X2 n=1 Tax=Babylonia areolata TaxID=304850 RepID=UPI003FCFA56F
MFMKSGNVVSCCSLTMKCGAVKALFGLFFFFFLSGPRVCLLSNLTLNRPECTSGKELILLDKRDVQLKCSGMERQWNIYWSLAGGRGGQRRIADCTGCDQNNCHGCSIYITQPPYTLNRYPSSSTIRFRADSQTHDGATLTCSTFSNANRVSCRLRVVQQITPHLPNCSNGQIVLPENRDTAITCTGLTSQYTVYWAMRGVTPGGTGFERLGDCTQCTQLLCPRCDPPKAGYSFSRTPTTTALKFRADYDDHNGAVVMCSSYPGHYSQTCELKVVKDYKMPQCHGGWLDLVEDEKVPPTVTCTQLTSNQSMDWFLVNNSTVHHVANCPPCTKEPCTQQCRVQSDDFRVSRTATNTSLTVVRNVRALAGQTLNCFLQKVIQEKCRISVLHGPSRAEVTTDDDLDPASVTLTCRVQGEVFPSASLTWNVPCTSVSDTDVSSTCKLRRDQVDRSGRDVVVECVATNSELSSLNATASLTLLFLGKEEVPKTEEALPLGLIAGIVTGVVVAAVVVAVIIIIVVRRKRANAPVHEIPMREAQSFSSGTAQAHQTSADNAGTRAQQTSAENARTRAQQTSADNAGTRAQQTSADNAGDHYYITVIDDSLSVQSPAGDSDYEIPETGTGPDMGGQPSSPGARDDTPEYVNRRAMGDNSQDDNSGDADYEIPDSATGPEIRAQSSSSGRGDDSPEYVNEGATGDNSQNDYMNTERLYSHLTATGEEYTYVQLNKP